LQHGADAHAPYSWSLEAAKRARDAGATVVVPFDRLDVFDRDRWICYLCHLPVDRDASAFDRSSPTVDHVVPLSRGGEHAMRNAACAHLGCNSAKQDRTAALAG
jgi:5-methylcytosine-specific restriction endonuclease McrA